jgi:hypothetical protein
VHEDGEGAKGSLAQIAAFIPVRAADTTTDTEADSAEMAAQIVAFVPSQARDRLAAEG